jgi:hypothetical protein
MGIEIIPIIFGIICIAFIIYIELINMKEWNLKKKREEEESDKDLYKSKKKEVIRKDGSRRDS